MNEFARRRAAFVEKMGDAVAVFPSAPAATRSNDTGFAYRQDTDLHYLTGFGEPESVLVLAPHHPTTKTVLFVRPRDKERETWDGRRAGIDGAVADYGADAAYPIAELDQRLPELLETAGTLYYAFDRDEAFDRRIVGLLRRYRTHRRRNDGGPLAVIDPGTVLHEQRVVKSAADVAGMRRAVAVSGEGHIAAMRHARPGMHEYEVQAIVEYVFTSRGAQSPAYTSIVGGGVNATILHYHENRERIPDGALVLVDAGAEVDYYCGDITRTWPISGVFSAEQRAIYEIVLAAESQCIAQCRPGVDFSGEVNKLAARVITEGLIDVGLLAGTVDENVESGAYKRFYMHRIGHYLGMDTHDVGPYRRGGKWRPLEPGMVVTVEPGIYVPDEPDVDARFRGIGVRIEDDILVTGSGADNLSESVPKRIDDVERTIAEARASGVPLFA